MVNLKKNTKENKRLWRGVFNFRTGLETEYARAFSPEQAKVFMMRRMAINHGVSYHVVFQMFNGNKPNFIIEEEKK
jgi:hypothetical protein